MKRVLAFVFACVCLGACSGNPPAWWNPNNRYGTAETKEATPTKATQSTPTQTQTTRKPIVKEEKLELIDVSYEEEDIVLTPMPDEDGENKTGAAAAQNEELTPDNVLPPPSILD